MSFTKTTIKLGKGIIIIPKPKKELEVSWVTLVANQKENVAKKAS